MNISSAHEIEICEIPPLTTAETSLLDMHSLLNLFSVLQGELYLLGGHLAGNGELFAALLARCDHFRGNLSDPVGSLRDAEELPAWKSQVDAALAEALAAHPERASTAEVSESLANIRSVFGIFSVRADEILARAKAPFAWQTYPIETLRSDFVAVFAAIERNSHGRYRILYNLARQGPTDYYVDFAVESQNGETIAMPILFKDVMRDLLANARKYTAPGGTINAGLYESPDTLTFVVSDTGCGIPRDEIELVVHYQRRGSNVSNMRTMGGGFGLTKAFLTAKRFGGRFWIASELGVGTRVRIEIPRPR